MEINKTFLIKQICGNNCISYPSGKALLDRIYPELKAKNKITLDFNEIRLFASPFFNMAIGTLFKEFKKDELSYFIKFKNLNQTGSTLLQRVIENSEKYYSMPRDKKAAFDELINLDKENSDAT